MTNGNGKDGEMNMRGGQGQGTVPPVVAKRKGYDPYSHGGAVIPPNVGAATFTFPEAWMGEYAFACAYGLLATKMRLEILHNNSQSMPALCIYARLSSPAVEACESKMVSLEPGADWAHVFPAGMGAVDGLVLACCHQAMKPQEGGPGAVQRNVVVYSGPLYGGTYAFLTSLMLRFGFEGVEVKLTEPETLRPVLEHYGDRVGLVYCETPANPTLDMVDIAAVRAVMEQVYAGKHRPVLAVDNTFMGVFQQPLVLGADVVLYSATKFLGGHSDLIGGFLVGRNDAPKSCTKPFIGKVVEIDLAGVVKFVRTISGLTTSSDVATRLYTHMLTYRLRMETLAKNALPVVDFLAGRPELEKVIFPTMLTGANKDVFDRQCTGASSMVAFVVKGDTQEAAYRFLDALQLCRRAVSLGFVETLADHPKTWTHSDMSPEDLARMGITDGMIRLSIGLEDPADIIADLEQALAAV